MGSDPSDAFAAIRRRPWLSLFVLALTLSAALLLVLRANIGFYLDDWALVFYREGSPTDWLLPHNEHIIVLPAALYKLSLAVFGMTAFPLHLVALALFLVSVILLYLWLKPLIGEPTAVLGCIVVLFLGAAVEDLIWAFQMGFFGSVAGGLGALLLIRRGNLRSDGWACVLLVVSLLFSTMALPFIAAAAVQIFLREGRDGWRVALRRSWVFLVPAAVYVIWWLGWGHLASNGMSLHNAVRAPIYSLSAFAYAAASLTGVFPLHKLTESNLWAVPGLLLAALLAAVVYRRRKIPPELLVALAAALTFWLLSGLNLVPGRGFHASRYQYPSVVFLLMILAGLFAGLRPNRRMIQLIGILVVCSLAVNVTALIYAFSNRYKGYEQRNLVSLTVFDVARRTVDPDFRVGISVDDTALVDAKAYFEAIDKYGSPALTESQIEAASSDDRDRFDQLLVEGLGVKPLPASAVTRIARSCRVVQADPTASEITEVKGQRLWIRSRNQTVIRLGRFGDGASAIGWATFAGKPLGYLIPADEWGHRWRIGFQGTGPVEVCQALPAG